MPDELPVGLPPEDEPPEDEPPEDVPLSADVVSEGVSAVPSSFDEDDEESSAEESSVTSSFEASTVSDEPAAALPSISSSLGFFASKNINNAKRNTVSAKSKITKK